MKAPTTTDYGEFKKVAGANTANGRKVIVAYDGLLECWVRFHPDSVPPQFSESLRQSAKQNSKGTKKAGQ